MEASERQYERVARRLDGEELTLSDDERELLRAVQADEARLAGRLDAPAPRRALARAELRLTEALRRPRLRVLRTTAAAMVTAAAAAVILLVSLWSAPGRVAPGRSAEFALGWREVPAAPGAAAEAEPGVPLSVAMAATEESLEATEIELVELEVGEMRSELAAAPTPELDTRIDWVERQLETFWLGEPAAEPLDL